VQEYQRVRLALESKCGVGVQPLVKDADVRSGRKPAEELFQFIIAAGAGEYDFQVCRRRWVGLEEALEPSKNRSGRWSPG
jgi:hypothetical protein